jgi:hypothetical protein
MWLVDTGKTPAIKVRAYTKMSNWTKEAPPVDFSVIQPATSYGVLSPGNKEIHTATDPWSIKTQAGIEAYRAECNPDIFAGDRKVRRRF